MPGADQGGAVTMAVEIRAPGFYGSFVMLRVTAGNTCGRRVLPRHYDVAEQPAAGASRS